MMLFNAGRTAFLIDIDGLVQSGGNSIAHKMELPQSCAEPSILTYMHRYMNAVYNGANAGDSKGGTFHK